MQAAAGFTARHRPPPRPERLAALVGASVSGAAVSGADNSGTTNVKVWLGLKNSDDVGTRFDLKAEVTNAAGERYDDYAYNVSGGSSGFNNAHLFTIPITGYAGTAGQAVSVTVWVRVSCASRHTSGTARGRIQIPSRCTGPAARRADD